ncbi:MAG: SpoIIE family protein phosphatase [Bacteroidales bacterium]|nr:SpoIIE family protein phosphatase [Bacteroidales bacterium]
MADGNNLEKEEFKTGKLLSISVIVVLILPLIIALYREWGFYIQNGGADNIISFINDRYSTPYMIYVDIICLAAAIAVCIFVMIIQKRIKASRMFVELASSANVPVFVIDTNRKLYWTNIGEIKFNPGTQPADTVKIITESPEVVEKISQCANSKETIHFEIETKLGEKRLWLHITLNAMQYKGKDVLCGTISDISNMKEAKEKIANQQRELQMQTEMLSLITAQMEVQQAGIKEQNDVLSDQHAQLERQAEELKNAFKELELRNKQIVTKTSYITDSIKYAQTIQEAMLPDEEQLNGFFSNFIIYRPKDIVSGDFYWLSETQDYIFVVLGDCTGHGVPGAFMSMIGIRLLGELINEQKIDRPSVILEAMDQRIQAALKQETTENTDGMDIAVCRLKRAESADHDWELKYCGAKQPIYIQRKDVSEIEVIESDRRGVGGQTIAEIFFFEDQDITLKNGDRIYMTSDGIKDQNNIMRKRFGTSRFKNMLHITHTEKIQDQKLFIDSIIRNWQGLEEQRDDISLWGFELSDRTSSI